MKNDANYIQGIPDLTILYKDSWATLECKKNKSASHRPNQDYYVKHMSEMSYSAFVYPENEEQVLKDLDMLFRRNTNEEEKLNGMAQSFERHDGRRSCDSES